MAVKRGSSTNSSAEYMFLYHFSRACRGGLSQRNDSPVSGKRHNLLLIFLKGRQCHLRLPGVSPVDGFTVVAQGQLGESLRIPDDLRPFRPRVAIGV